MSKIGKINIAIPDKVKVSLNGSNLNMEGPLGKNSLVFDINMFDLNIQEGKEVSIKPKIINQNTKKIWGLNRSLINNAIKGINEGYTKTLELSGVGFRAAIKGSDLNLQIGFSHDVNFKIPEGIFQVPTRFGPRGYFRWTRRRLGGVTRCRRKNFCYGEPRSPCGAPI